MQGNKAHETSAPWNYTLSGYTPKMFLGMNFGQNYMQKCRESHKTSIGNLVINNSVGALGSFSSRHDVLLMFVHEMSQMTGFNLSVDD